MHVKQTQNDCFPIIQEIAFEITTERFQKYLILTMLRIMTHGSSSVLLVKTIYKHLLLKYANIYRSLEA